MGNPARTRAPASSTAARWPCHQSAAGGAQWRSAGAGPDVGPAAEARRRGLPGLCLSRHDPGAAHTRRVVGRQRTAAASGPPGTPGRLGGCARARNRLLVRRVLRNPRPAQGGAAAAQLHRYLRCPALARDHAGQIPGMHPPRYRLEHRDAGGARRRRVGLGACAWRACGRKRAPGARTRRDAGHRRSQARRGTVAPVGGAFRTHLPAGGPAHGHGAAQRWPLPDRQPRLGGAHWHHTGRGLGPHRAGAGLAYPRG